MAVLCRTVMYTLEIKAMQADDEMFVIFICNMEWGQKQSNPTNKWMDRKLPMNVFPYFKINA